VSRYDYERSMELTAVPFHALIMAAMRKADDRNAVKLRAAWPEVWDELYARYWAPGGLLPDERPAPTTAPENSDD
jgi:hypothetical protein